MRRVLVLFGMELVVALGLCVLSALQAAAISALVARALGPPSVPAPPRAEPEPPCPVQSPCLERAFGGRPPRPKPLPERSETRPSLPALLAGAQLRPTAQGLALSGVHPGSLLDAIGLVDGDVLTRVNGLDARRPEAALFAFTRARSGGDLALGIERNGRPITILYHVR